MTECLRDILEKLMETLKSTGVSPIPNSQFLRERISSRMKGIQSLVSEEGNLNPHETKNFTSPVCFSTSDEVQPDYQNEYFDLPQIDKYIDQLILGKEK